MSKTRDFNHLGKWLPEQIKLTGMPMFKIANRAAISRSVVYGWMSDKFRPDSDTLLKFVQVIAELRGVNSAKLHAEALSQYVNRPEGRKSGADWAGQSETRTKSGRAPRKR